MRHFRFRAGQVRSTFFLALAIGFPIAGISQEPQPRRRHVAPAITADPPVTATASTATPTVPAEAPVSPDGVTDLPFKGLFRFPAGPAGLEYTEPALTLAGKKVRITGYMVRQAQPIPWAFILSPVPQSLHEREYGLCDDLPMTAIHVFVPRNSQPMVPHLNGPVTVTGVLELGGHEEADGRVSTARIRVLGSVADGIVPVDARANMAVRR